MLLCIWFPSESGVLTLNLFSLGVGDGESAFVALERAVDEGRPVYLAFTQVRLGSMGKLFSLKLTISEGSITDFLVT